MFTRFASALLLPVLVLAGATPHHRRARHRLRLKTPLQHILHVHIAGGPWSAPTFADSTSGDRADGDDPLIRHAAVAALGPYNGSVIVLDPHTGRILTIVNQKLAVSGAFQPCSTIKLVTAIAGLSQDTIHPDTLVRTGARRKMTLLEALKHSSNRYFAGVGSDLGFDTFVHYARMVGLGETAGLNIEDETSGILPPSPPADDEGGMGMMTSFGLGVAVTPLEMAALISAIANDGTLYYLQYPRTQPEAAHFVPRIKRDLDIRALLPGIKAGMLAAVELGTGRRANDGPDDPVFGKTGTCTDGRSATHLGWFASFNRGTGRNVAVVVLLTGGQPVNGTLAASIAGAVYRTLHRNDCCG